MGSVGLNNSGMRAFLSDVVMGFSGLFCNAFVMLFCSSYGGWEWLFPEELFLILLGKV